MAVQIARMLRDKRQQYCQQRQKKSPVHILRTTKSETHSKTTAYRVTFDSEKEEERAHN